MRIKRLKLKIFILGTILFFAFFHITKYFKEGRMLQKIIERLTADSRIAEVLVTDVKFDSKARKTYTTIKFLEYDTNLKPIKPRYFTFSGNIIQFQSLIIRFDDIHIRNRDKFRGKSAYLFWKIFMLDGRTKISKSRDNPDKNSKKFYNLIR